MANPLMPSLRSLPFSPINERHKIFAFDFIFFLSKKYRTNWTPYGRPDYFIDPLSPLTSDLEEAARIILRNTDERLAQKYEKLVPPRTAHSGIFLKYARQIFQFSLHEYGAPEPDDLFRAIIFVGKLAVLFHQNGVHDVLNFAVIEIGETLLDFMLRYGSGIFPAFRAFALQVIQEDGGSENGTGNTLTF